MSVQKKVRHHIDAQSFHYLTTPPILTTSDERFSCMWLASSTVKCRSQALEIVLSESRSKFMFTKSLGWFVAYQAARAKPQWSYFHLKNYHTSLGMQHKSEYDNTNIPNIRYQEDPRHFKFKPVRKKPKFEKITLKIRFLRIESIW